MKKIITIALFVLSYQLLLAQDYTVAAIPESLLVDADAIVRYDETVFTQADINNGTAKYTTVITVMRKEGDGHANFVVQQDRFRELKNFSGTVLHPETGKVVKKISKNDLTTTAYSLEMSSDDKYSFYQYQSPSYPYTIKYEYEVRFKNGIPAYPIFFPVGGYGLAVERAVHTLTLPANQNLRYKAIRTDKGEPQVEKNGSSASYTWTLDGIAAIRNEAFSPHLRDIVPMVMLAPDEFCMEGKCGKMTDWEILGRWHYSLLEGRDVIPSDLKVKLQELTRDADSDKEKVRRVYEYLQSTTRYVSIQLGIGGLQPIGAEKVVQTGFGDCKALSNYMKAMLNAIEIPSVYVAISTTRRDLQLDFPSLTQMNHVVLMVPLANDSLWLECTSQLIPFSYVHGDIAGHHAFLIKENASSICRVKEAPEVVEKTTSMDVALDEDGHGQALVSIDYRQEMYRKMLGFTHNMSRDEQVNYLAESLKMQKVKISDLEFTAKHDENPMLELKFKILAERYANKTGNRLFVPLSPLKIGGVNILRNGKRALDIVIASSTPTVDTLHIKIPDTFTSESIPQSLVVQSDFGTYSVDVELEGQILKVVQSVILKPGRYSVDKAQEFQDFLRKIDKESNRKAVFRKS